MLIRLITVAFMGRRAEIDDGAPNTFNSPRSMTLPSTGYIRQRQQLASVQPFSAANLWRKVKAQTFPAPVKLSAGVTA